jgi:hypothetical protein
VAEPVACVEPSASCLHRLAAIESFLSAADVASACDTLPGEPRTTVIPNLRRCTRIGRCGLDQPPQSAAALAPLAALPAGAADRLRAYRHGEDLIPYTVATPGHGVHLLSIRHQRDCPSGSLGRGPGRRVVGNAEVMGNRQDRSRDLPRDRRVEQPVRHDGHEDAGVRGLRHPAGAFVHGMQPDEDPGATGRPGSSHSRPRGAASRAGRSRLRRRAGDAESAFRTWPGNRAPRLSMTPSEFTAARRCATRRAR